MNRRIRQYSHPRIDLVEPSARLLAFVALVGLGAVIQHLFF